MVIILITLVDDSLVYTTSLTVISTGDIKTDEILLDITVIKKTQILWVDKEEFALQNIKKV